jgi:hypothetical protein
MRPDVVIVVASESQLVAGIGQAVKDLFVEAPLAQAAVDSM